ncbi:Dpi35p NDAI_0H02760 [Naumovozyma dairenensis CBS 421]|uniref:Uncharacterized protein n=1 Tax=Naumovozyma dairenensis (strain ATCC 10597 / BCRC 20456 / CBS 421 / NBRC 0211 / NRRL Y-12639) TaxID=1071378 RepID=G0WF89_NAUDC|nr:hypothetical protein NDAI_0H02760 [Naumovozyma dairenensis CBS 421]CCD26450.1 hypothetical protein NDAI_0H02760 [Naumovozyma dairenensis CBS 421]
MTFPKKISINNFTQILKTEIPKIITFDAYNTLYTTTLPILEQYCLVGSAYGIHANPSELSKNFPQIFKDLATKYPNYGKTSGLAPEQWWGYLIKNIFKPTDIPIEMVNEILLRFEGSQAYAIHPDLLELLKYIKEMHPNVVMGIISNTDPIIFKVLENLGILKYFKDYVYLSYDTGIKKPNVEVFNFVLKDIVKTNPSLNKGDLSNLKRQCWHIGDELHNDMMAAKDAGWNGVLIDRINKSGYLTESFEHAVSDTPLLLRDKLHTNSEESWKISSVQTDLVQVSGREYVVPNFYVLKNLLFYQQNKS